jgi:hypothetical protein
MIDLRCAACIDLEEQCVACGFDAQLLTEITEPYSTGWHVYQIAAAGKFLPTGMSYAEKLFPDGAGMSSPTAREG